MKKTFLLIMATCFCFMAEAQISQGSKSIGGTFNYSSSSSKSEFEGTSRTDYKTSNFTFSPRVGYFISDEISIGAALTLSTGSQTDYDGNNTQIVRKTNSFAISPFARYYKSLGENFYIFGEGMISVGSGGSKRINGNTTVKDPNSGIFGLYVSPGIAFFPAPKFGIELSFVGIQFENRSSKGENSKTSTSSFRFGPNTFSPNLGLQFYF